MDACNGLQLQLSECIESLKCEVKQKMKHEVGRRSGTKVIEEACAEDLRCRRRNFRWDNRSLREILAMSDQQ